ncbi:MAG: VanW family protein [Lachnospiraceae bacterium]|nr:VanW family protein [Lachnospiraceae bacterium]
MMRANKSFLKNSARALSGGLIFALFFSAMTVTPYAYSQYSLKAGGANVGVKSGDQTAQEEKPQSNEESGGVSLNFSSGSGSPEEGYEAGNETVHETANEPVHEAVSTTNRIVDYVYAGPVALSGKNFAEAEAAIEQYISGLRQVEITLVSVDGNTSSVTAGQMGIFWKNPEILNEALLLGNSGNIIARYKTLKDLEHEPQVFPIELSCDKEKVRSLVEAEGEKYNIPPVNPRVRRENGAFTVLQEGSDGYEVDVDASVKTIMKAMDDFTGEPEKIELTVAATKARGTEEDFAMMKDVLGAYHTSFSSSSADRSGNVKNGTKLINGTMLYPGDQFSVYQAVSPFTEENGYFLAGSYANGLVVESLGGGICQVSSTLYNAVLRAELQVDERHNHSMIVTYVDLSSDAAISGTEKDFKFTNNLDNPIYIEGYTTDSKEVYFTIYGVETRPQNRSVSFESVEISKTEAEGVNIVADNSQPVGYMHSQSAHTGYVGELWKVVKTDGVETERTQINRSTYKMVPKTVAVGTKADDASISEMVRAAIASGDLDTVKGTIANLEAAARGEAVIAPVPTPEEQMAAIAAAMAAQTAVPAEAPAPADNGSGEAQ